MANELPVFLGLFSLLQLIHYATSSCEVSACNFPTSFQNSSGWYFTSDNDYTVKYESTRYMVYAGTTQLEYSCMLTRVDDNVHYGILCGPSVIHCERNIINVDENIIVNTKITSGFSESSTIDDCVNAMNEVVSSNVLYWKDSIMTSISSCGPPNGEYHLTVSDTTNGRDACLQSSASNIFIEETTITIESCTGDSRVYTCASTLYAGDFEQDNNGDFIIAAYEDGTTKISPFRWIMNDTIIYMNVAMPTSGGINKIVTNTPVTFYGSSTVDETVSYVAYRISVLGCGMNCNFPQAFIDVDLWYFLNGLSNYGVIFTNTSYSVLPAVFQIEYTCKDSFIDGNKHYSLLCGSAGIHCERNIVNSDGNLLIQTKITDGFNDSSTIEDCVQAIRNVRERNILYWTGAITDLSTTCGISMGEYFLTVSNSVGESQCSSHGNSRVNISDTEINITSCTGFERVFTCVYSFTAEEVEQDDGGDFIVVTWDNDGQLETAILRWSMSNSIITMNMAMTDDGYLSVFMSNTSTSYFGVSDVNSDVTYTVFKATPIGLCLLPPAYTEVGFWWVRYITTISTTMEADFTPDAINTFIYNRGLWLDFFSTVCREGDAMVVEDKHYIAYTYDLPVVGEKRYCVGHFVANGVVINTLEVTSDGTVVADCPSIMQGSNRTVYNAYMPGTYDMTIVSPFPEGTYYTSFSYPGGPWKQCKSVSSSVATIENNTLVISSCDSDSTYLRPTTRNLVFVQEIGADMLDLDSADGDFVILMDTEQAFYFARYKMEGDDTIELTISIPQEDEEAVWHDHIVAGDTLQYSHLTVSGTRYYNYVEFEFTKDKKRHFGFEATGEFEQLSDDNQQLLVSQIRDKVRGKLRSEVGTINVTFARDEL